MTLLLERGRVVCPVQGIDRVDDVLISGGRIARIGRGAVPVGAERWDCGGLVVAPGLVDLYADLGDPGFAWREDLSTGTQAAAAGGFSTLLLTPDTAPVQDNAAVVAELLSRAGRDAAVRVRVAAAATVGMAGQELVDVGFLAEAGCAALSDGGRPITESDVLRRVLDYARPHGLPVLLRPADVALERDGLMHEGDVSLEVGLRGVPAAAEEIGVGRLVALARVTGARVHLSHVTTAEGVALVRRAKEQGLQLTGSVPARHLVLTDRDVGDSQYDPNLRLLPPLRPESDRAAVVEAVREGVLVVISDHRPLSRVEKEHEFVRAAPGAIGLETALSATLTALDGDVSAAVQALAAGPASVVGATAALTPGSPADVVVFDPTVNRVVPRAVYSRSANEPLEGRALQGEVRALFVGGRAAFGPITD